MITAERPGVEGPLLLDRAPDILTEEPAAPSLSSEVKRAASDVRGWPLTAKLLAVALAAVFAPVIWEAAELWLTDDSFAHGLFIFPVALFLLWMAREEIRRAPSRPAAWGLLPLWLGLALETSAYLARIRFLALAAIVPAVAGAVLLCCGAAKWRAVRFPVTYLLFSVPIPGFILALPQHWIQSVSSTGAAATMKLLGYPILQTGNIIEIPGMALEVADICSGFKKLFALLAISLLYGYIFNLPAWKRCVLLLSAVPIAVIANVARISGLIAVSSAWGMRGLHAAHDGAELFVVVVAFMLLMGVGKVLGCKTPRFYRSAGSY